MKFSILIPVYNVEGYLEQCFDSVINQTYSDYEIIVIDDGSTDSCAELCDAFAEQHPDKVVVIHTENKGLIAARRTAIERAEGEFCVFVDSDDYIEPTLLQTVSQYISKEENIDIVIYSFSYFNQQNCKKYRSWAPDCSVWNEKSKRELYELLVTGDTIDSLWTKAIRTNLLKRDPIDYQRYYGQNMSEDVLQSIYPLTFARKVIFADVSLYNYRYNSESIARNFRSETISKKNSSHVFEEILKVLPIWNLGDTEIYKKVYARWFSDAMYIFWKSCEFAENKDDWNNIFETAWTEMLPRVDISEYKKYVSEHYLSLYEKYTDNKLMLIRFHFLKKRLYRKLKIIKGMIRKSV